jgi:hypothetical protein
VQLAEQGKFVDMYKSIKNVIKRNKDTDTLFNTIKNNSNNKEDLWYNLGLNINKLTKFNNGIKEFINASSEAEIIRFVQRYGFSWDKSDYKSANSLGLKRMKRYKEIIEDEDFVEILSYIVPIHTHRLKRSKLK